MDDSRLRYGFFTTYHDTYFVRRTSDTTFQISEAVRHDTVSSANPLRVSTRETFLYLPTYVGNQISGGGPLLGKIWLVALLKLNEIILCLTNTMLSLDLVRSWDSKIQGHSCSRCFKKEAPDRRRQTFPGIKCFQALHGRRAASEKQDQDCEVDTGPDQSWQLIGCGIAWNFTFNPLISLYACTLLAIKQMSWLNICTCMICVELFLSTWLVGCINILLASPSSSFE